MVARNYFKLIIYFLFFFGLNNFLISEDKMDGFEISIDSATELYKSNKLKIVDVRTKKEWKMTGVIPNSFLVNMHNEDFSENPDFIKNIEDILKINKNTNIAFICASGARSEIVVNYFKEKSYNNIFHIPQGILGKEKDGWFYLGLPLESYYEDTKEKN